MSVLNKEFFSSLSGKLQKDKRSFLIVIIGVLGILMLFISEFIPEKAELSEDIYKENVISEEKQKEELRHIISSIKGVGKTEVMIIYEGTSESIYAHNTSLRNNSSETDSEEEHIILDKGNTEEGLLLKELYPKVTGIAVVCEGGEEPTIKNEITQMLKALYNISSNSISISEMNS